MRNYILQIKQILEKNGWTQTQFAGQLGVTFTTVNRWLNGHTQPHPGQLRSIEKIFRDTVGIEPLSGKKVQGGIHAVVVQQKKIKNIQAYLKKKEIAEEFLLELTYHSDAIEGSTLTKKETEAVIFDKAMIKEKSLIEHLEAVNHSTILKEIFEGEITGPINEGLIKQIHRRLMQGIRDDAGEYARLPRAIRGVDLVLPHPDDIPEEMQRFCRKVNLTKGHPIEHIAGMHADFEMIHPFGDGNGRVGRLLMVIQLIQCGFAPCLITVNQKAKYYECLEFAQKKSETHLIHFLSQRILAGYVIIKKFL